MQVDIDYKDEFINIFNKNITREVVINYSIGF
jgi:hypothetical protein